MKSVVSSVSMSALALTLGVTTGVNYRRHEQRHGDVLEASTIILRDTKGNARIHLAASGANGDPAIYLYNRKGEPLVYIAGDGDGSQLWCVSTIDKSAVKLNVDGINGPLMRQYNDKGELIVSIGSTRYTHVNIRKPGKESITASVNQPDSLPELTIHSGPIGEGLRWRAVLTEEPAKKSNTPEAPSAPASGNK